MILAYMMIFALQQDRSFQISWLRTLFVSLSGDILVLSTLVIYFNHVYVPQLFLSDTQYLTSGMKSMFNDGKNVMHETIEQFAANKYLFVSHWIASAHPSSKVSSIVLNYSTPWPRRSYKGTSINGVSIVAILMLFEVMMGMPSSLQNELCKFILLAFLANIATSELLQREYRTWVKIAVTLFLLTVLYAIGRLLGYVLRRVSGKRRWSRHMASADVIPSDVTNQTSARRASLHVTRRASAAQAIEALQQVTEAVALSEAKEISNNESFDNVVDYFENMEKSQMFSSTSDSSVSALSDQSMELVSSDGASSREADTSSSSSDSSNESDQVMELSSDDSP
jgi:hypothetical protein